MVKQSVTLCIGLGRHERCQSPRGHRQHQQLQSQHQLKPADGYYYCVWRANDDDESMPIPVVCENEPSSTAAAAAADNPASSCSSADRQPAQLGICYSDVIASTDVTTPEHLRHRSSWPEDALAEHLTHMRSC